METSVQINNIAEVTINEFPLEGDLADEVPVANEVTSVGNDAEESQTVQVSQDEMRSQANEDGLGQMPAIDGMLNQHADEAISDEEVETEPVHGSPDSEEESDSDVAEPQIHVEAEQEEDSGKIFFSAIVLNKHRKRFREDEDEAVAGPSTAGPKRARWSSKRKICPHCEDLIRIADFEHAIECENDFAEETETVAGNFVHCHFFVRSGF